MKTILMLLFSFNIFAYDYFNKIEEVSYEDSRMTDRMRSVIYEKDIKEITKKHFGKDVTVKQIHKAILESIEEGPGTDLLLKILTKIVGPELAKAILDLTAIPEIEEKIISLGKNLPGLFVPETCLKSLHLVTEDLAYLIAFAAVAIYAPQPLKVLASLAGSTAVGAVKLVYAFSKIDEGFCDILHRSYYEIYSY